MGTVLGFFKAINIQGIIGLVAAAVLTFMLIGAKIDARHWKKQSTRFEQLYKGEQAAHLKTVNNYQAAALEATRLDAANKRRVETLQEKVNEERDVSFNERIAAARLRAAAAAATNSRRAAGTPVPGAAGSAAQPNEASEADTFSAEDRLTATEQAIQLDELIKWVNENLAIDIGND